MQLAVCFDISDIERLAAINKMESYSKGGKTIYQIPDKVSQFSGVWFKIENHKATLKFSLQKQYFREVLGRLDNSQMFTMAQAKGFIFTLLQRLGVNPETAKVKYYEVGLSLPVTNSPLEYIKAIKAVGATEKETFIDAYYQKNRQRTTEKTRNLKKVYKIYDKLFEVLDRAKVPFVDNGKGGILRIETIYKRQSKPLTALFTNKALQKIAAQFFADWQNAVFAKELATDKGTKDSQRQNALHIFDIGLDNFCREIETAYKSHKISRETYRTKKRFADNWLINSAKYQLLPTALETEFKAVLKENMRIAQIVDYQPNIKNSKLVEIAQNGSIENQQVTKTLIIK